MGRLAPLRDELLRGDMRPLYLGWLAGVSAGEVNEKSTEPEPPSGLSRLSAAQQSLADFLEVDEDLLSAVAGTTTALAGSATMPPVNPYLILISVMVCLQTSATR
jgi:hypothetical protein